MTEPAVARSEYSALDPCVHCGFCLPACPTYLATGDENDSPRGRIVLMRAVERGELAATDPAVRQHLDACLGCRGCEPVCPSGVGYGRGLEAARTDLARANGFGATTRAALSVFGTKLLWRLVFGAARLLRDWGIAERVAGTRGARFWFGMVAASGRAGGWDGRTGGQAGRRTEGGSGVDAADRLPARPPVRLFEGCVMSVLFRHVHEATRRTLAVNGFTVADTPSTVCCGAPHAHAGDVAGARALARRNVAALHATEGEIVVNSAGCGAILKDYGHLLGTDQARAVADRVRDVSELLADAGPRPGAPLPIRVAYDAPCHLQHAQRVHRPVLTLLSAAGLEVRSLPGADRCCGSAGIFNLVQPEMARAVLAAKLVDLGEAASELDAVATGNPGCQMQIGAGLRAARIPLQVMHPVELLDRSYAAAGFYGPVAGPSDRP